MAPLPVGLPVECAGPTGAPAELALVGSAPVVRFVRAGRRGFARAGSLALPREVSGCAVVARSPSGAGVVAVVRRPPAAPDELDVLLRDRGKRWGAPAVLARGPGLGPHEPVAAVSARGDALVAWFEGDDVEHQVLRAAVRPAGGAFGEPVTVDPGADGPLRVLAGVDDGGDAVLVWTSAETPVRAPERVPVQAAVAPGGAGFGPPQALGEVPAAGSVALAVASDGRALVALPGFGGMRVAERPPGGAFTAPVAVARTADPGGEHAAVAVGPGGRAAVAWSGIAHGDAGVVLRAAAGPFRPAVVLARGRPVPGPDPFFGSALAEDLGNELDGLQGEQSAGVALTGGEALVTWLGPRAGATVARADAVSLSGSVRRLVTSGVLRDAGWAAPLRLAGGAPAIAWEDNANPDVPRLHVALAGATRTAPAAPAVHVGPPAREAVPWHGPLRLPVRCSAACDVRAWVGAENGRLTLPRAGRGMLTVSPESGPIVAAGRHRVRARIRYGAAGAAHARARMLSLVLRQAGHAPVGRPYGLRATRAGDRVRVTWNVRGDSSATVFLVTGAAAPDGPAVAFTSTFQESPRRHIAVTLPGAVQSVTLHTTTSVPGGVLPPLTVAVGG